MVVVHSLLNPVLKWNNLSFKGNIYEIIQVQSNPNSLTWAVSIYLGHLWPVHDFQLRKYYVAYLGYPPLFFAGPILSFNAFVSQLEQPILSYTAGPSQSEQLVGSLRSWRFFFVFSLWGWGWRMVPTKVLCLFMFQFFGGVREWVRALSKHEGVACYSPQFCDRT